MRLSASGGRVRQGRLGALSQRLVYSHAEYQAAQHSFRGGFEAYAEDGQVHLVNRVPLEDYVAGTVAREVYPAWEGVVLEVQAVIARTYALYHQRQRERQPFDLRADVLSQVYGGTDVVLPRVARAVEATRGQYLEYGGEPILAVFHSAAGGTTASAEEVWGKSIPYLGSVFVADEEDSPDTYWRIVLSQGTLGRVLGSLGYSLGRVRGVRVAKRSPSGRVLLLDVEGRRGRAEISGRALREALGAAVLRSTQFEIQPRGSDFIIVGSGSGHGVGLSQWGAFSMAQEGKSVKEIVQHFYPGTQLRGKGTDLEAFYAQGEKE